MYFSSLLHPVILQVKTLASLHDVRLDYFYAWLFRVYLPCITKADSLLPTDCQPFILSSYDTAQRTVIRNIAHDCNTISICISRDYNTLSQELQDGWRDIYERIYPSIRWFTDTWCIHYRAYTGSLYRMLHIARSCYCFWKAFQTSLDVRLSYNVIRYIYVEH